MLALVGRMTVGALVAHALGVVADPDVAEFADCPPPTLFART